MDRVKLEPLSGHWLVDGCTTFGDVGDSAVQYWTTSCMQMLRWHHRLCCSNVVQLLSDRISTAWCGHLLLGPDLVCVRLCGKQLCHGNTNARLADKPPCQLHGVTDEHDRNARMYREIVSESLDYSLVLLTVLHSPSCAVVFNAYWSCLPNFVSNKQNGENSSRAAQCKAHRGGLR